MDSHGAAVAATNVIPSGAAIADICAVVLEAAAAHVREGGSGMDGNILKLSGDDAVTALAPKSLRTRQVAQIVSHGKATVVAHPELATIGDIEHGRVLICMLAIIAGIVILPLEDGGP